MYDTVDVFRNGKSVLVSVEHYFVFVLCLLVAEFYEAVAYRYVYIIYKSNSLAYLLTGVSLISQLMYRHDFDSISKFLH